MPELPEVEVTRKLCERYLVGERIVEIRVQEDPIVFSGQSPQWLQEKLLERSIRACHRRGKYFWWELDQGALLLHLGMTGAVQVPHGPSLQLSHGIDYLASQWPPRFTKLDLLLASGQRLAFCDPRRFGRVQWQEDPRTQAPVVNLGIDPLCDTLDYADVARALSSRRGTIKGLLLNQRVIAGLGNWIADEVLYQAGIDPRCIAGKLNPTQTRALHEAILMVVRTAVQANADASLFPPDWLFHHRWGKKAALHPHTGEKIEFLDLAGRSTAWVPSKQRPS